MDTKQIVLDAINKTMLESISANELSRYQTLFHSIQANEDNINFIECYFDQIFPTYTGSASQIKYIQDFIKDINANDKVNDNDNDNANNNDLIQIQPSTTIQIIDDTNHSQVIDEHHIPDETMNDEHVVNKEEDDDDEQSMNNRKQSKNKIIHFEDVPFNQLRTALITLLNTYHSMLNKKIHKSTISKSSIAAHNPDCVICDVTVAMANISLSKLLPTLKCIYSTEQYLIIQDLVDQLKNEKSKYAKFKKMFKNGEIVIDTDTNENEITLENPKKSKNKRSRKTFETNTDSMTSSSLLLPESNTIKQENFEAIQIHKKHNDFLDAIVLELTIARDDLVREIENGNKTTCLVIFERIFEQISYFQNANK